MTKREREAKKAADERIVSDSPFDTSTETQRVATCGYEWRTVGKIRVLSPIEDNADVRVIAPASIRGLVFQFATIESTEASFREFANEFGRLGCDSVDLATTENPAPRFQFGDSFDGWTRSQRRIALAVDLLNAIRANTITRWVHLIEKRALGIVWRIFIEGAADESTTIPIGGMGGEESTVSGAARWFLQSWINAGLVRQTAAVVKWNDRRGEFALRLLPFTLIGSMWWQLGRALCGEVEFGCCKICEKALEIGKGSFSANREFCSPKCKQQDHRDRVKLAKELKANGATVKQIAKQLGTEPEVIKHWLIKKK